ncbi:unnamed protein product [Rotaria socialis]|uniref:Uncharacterized protein n=2 Tax=Rotaria socialis TaxID=392032 RepID=A0A820Z9T9_9BILA|nr:unnamed protein product [Rotaria socialis]
MATATNYSCNIKDCKKRATMTCLGCPDLFYCSPHHKEHRSKLNTDLQDLTDKCNAFLDEFETQVQDSQKHAVMKIIDEWETKSIEKIKRLAQETREELIHHAKKFIPGVKMQLISLSTEIRQDPDDDGFVDTDIENWKKELQRLKTILNNPPDFTVRQDSTEFISKIYLKVEGMSNIPANAKWTQDGITVAGGNGKGSATNQLSSPWGLFFDDDQTVVIADHGNQRIIQWKKDDTTNGQVVAGGKGKGNELNQLKWPTDVLINEETDSLIICDYGNRRVVRWSRHSNAIQGEILIDNIDCFGLSIDDQRYLYVSDHKKHEVRRYQLGDKNGTLVAGGNGEGANLNQLHQPRHLFVDRQQNVYISDWQNHRVMKWHKGSKEGIIVAGGHGNGNALTQLSSPHGLFVDTLGALYVTDTMNDRVMRWPQGVKQGTVIAGGNGREAGANQFNQPVCLSFDRHGNLYVVDRLNNRVQRFSIK